MYHKYQMVMGYLHENPVSNGGQLQATQELKPNELLLLLLLLLLLIPPVKAPDREICNYNPFRGSW
jgi:hypothetical protein